MHDPLCPYEIGGDECHCHSIANARADERIKALFTASTVHRDEWADLRDKVEVLGPPQSSWNSPNAGEGWLDAIQAVLALFDGNSNPPPSSAKTGSSDE